MATDREFAFGSFRFDARSGQLWRERRQLKLTPRAAAVLCHLAERAQELVTKQDLFERVWSGMAVGDDALTSCIQELRGALGDNARRPRYIETLHRRGYRLMVQASLIDRCSDSDAVQPVNAPKPCRLVGRVTELDELAGGFDQARSGRRQLLFLTGEPGIGKSSLADAFLDQLRASRAVKIAHGQCLDHHGVGEPYLPLIEAFTRLAGGQGGRAVKEVLSAQAPSWLAQMPSLWTRSERRALETRSRATRERMMRELTLAVEVIASDTPLLLKLEDIHWSDVSSLDWLAHVARRPDPARLLILATLRPADPAAAKVGLGALVTELSVHGWCKEIALPPLALDDIENYLKARLRDEDRTAQWREMAPLLLERTGGNPLFMTSIVNHLVQPEGLKRVPAAIMSIPPDVRRFIDLQIDELNEHDRNLLSAASVIRREFATPAVAAALNIDDAEVETACSRLTRQGVFIVKSRSATWPDGTRAELFFFRHDLYRELLYERLPARLRAMSHLRVGHRLETGWADRLDAIAAELAEHFERGNELILAIPHHQRAAGKALRRSANAEAIGHLQRALDAVGQIADETERIRTEVHLRIALGAAFIATRGFGAPEVLEAYLAAEALCNRLGDHADIFPALWGQWLFHWGRSELEAAWQLCKRLLVLAQRFGDPGLKLQAHHATWATSFGRGQLAEVQVHVEAGLAIYDAESHQAMASSYGNHDASTCARNFAALALALAGRDERARATAGSAVAVARNLNDPFSLALTLFFASATEQVLGNFALAAQHADASRQIAIDHDLVVARAWSTGVAGWCAAELGDHDRGIAMLVDAIAVLRTTQSRYFLSYFLGLLADAHMKAGHHEDAMKAVDEGGAMVEASGERYYSAELHRLHGELLARPPRGHFVKAEASFRTAIKVASQQGAFALQRKATESLRQWCGPQGGQDAS
jgi:DNA-binding winged helix-turn-helix (wHTH) protein/predicted ATPase